MANRREKVTLTLDDDFTTRAALVAASAREMADAMDSVTESTRSSSRANNTAARSTDRYSESQRRLHSTMRQLPGDFARSQQGMDGFSRRARQSERQLDSVTGRVNLLAEALVTLGPGLVPVGALAVPAISGLSNQLGFAVIAAGTAAVAFHGVGDALKAVNDASLEPSAENLEKVRQAMQAIGPEGADLVATIHGLGDEWRTLQRASQSELFPGLTDAIGSLEGLTPQLAGILRETGGALGDIARSGAESLASDRWEGFFTFLQANARPTLTGLADAGGNLAHALAEIWQATTPLNNGFTNWLVDATGDLDRFATGLDQTQGFQDFIAYVRQEGPQVGATLGAVANAALQIAEAAAPIGGPVLHALEAVAKVVSIIADSDFGTPLIAGTAAVLALNRALTLTQKLVGSRGTIASQVNRPFETLTSGATRASATVRTFGSDLATVARSGTVFNRAARQSFSGVAGSIQTGFVGPLTQAQDRAVRTSAATERLGGNLRTLGKAGAGVAALAVVTSGLGDSMGITNTATLAMAGSLAGPWGAGVGAGVGLLLDFAKANDTAVDATKSFGAVLKGTDFAGFNAQLEAQRKALKDREDALPDNQGKSWLTKGINEASVDDFLNGTTEKLRTVTAQGEAAGLALQTLAKSMGAKNQLGAYGELMGQFTASAADMQQVITTAGPVLARFGVSLDDLGDMDPRGVRQLGGVVKDYVRYVDSGQGKTDAFVDSLQGLSSQYLTTADSASSFASALDAMLTPTLDAEQANDQFQTTLRGLSSALKDKAGFTGFTKAAVANRDATRAVVRESQAMLVARAKAGASEASIAKSVRNTRREFIAEVVASGKSRRAAVARANALGLTPKLVRTVMQVAGAARAEALVKRHRSLLAQLPKSVRTIIKADGVPKTKTDLEALDKKAGGLTKRQRAIIVKLQGNEKAQGDLKKTQTAADNTDKKKPKVKVTADTAGATSAISTFQARVNALTGKTITITTNHVNTGAQADGGYWPGGLFTYASGGTLPGQAVIQPGRGRGLVQWAEGETGGEAFIPLGLGKRDRSTAILDQVATDFGYRLETMAQGGTRNRKPSPVKRADKQFNLTPTLDLSGVQSELRDFEKAIKHAGLHLGRRFDALSKQALDTAKALGDERDHLSKLLDKQSEVRSNAAGSINNDIFGGDLAGLQLQLAADTNDNNAITADIKKAGGKGLSGGLEQGLAASGNVALVDQISKLSASQIAQLEKQYDARTKAQNALGDIAVKMSGLPEAIRASNAEIARMSAKIERLEHQIENGVRRGARQGLNDHDRNRDRKGVTRAATGRR